MLFFTRAFVCIGTIVILAEGWGPADLVTRSRETAGTAAEAAAAQMAELCRARPAECLALAGMAGKQAAAPVTAPARARAGQRPVRLDLSLRPPAPK